MRAPKRSSAYEFLFTVFQGFVVKCFFFVSSDFFILFSFFFDVSVR